MAAGPSSDPFRVAFVAGVTPDRWVRRWRERLPGQAIQTRLVEQREQRAVLYDGRAQMCFVRQPVEPTGLHLVPLYVEQPVVVMSTEHLLAALDEVTSEDLADALVNEGPAKQAIETAAAGTGVVVVPQSVARLHRRRDVTTRPLVDGTPTEIGLAWRSDLDDPRTEVFLGIVRGRTERSSRGTPSTEPRAEQAGQQPAGRTSGRPARPGTRPGRRPSRRPGRRPPRRQPGG